MTTTPGKIFNSTGAPSEDLKRHLLYLAMIDSGAVLTGHKPLTGFGPNAHDQDAAAAASLLTFAQLITTRQARLDALNDRINELEQASYAALIETKRQLARARQRLQQIRERAHKITLPDGTVMRVYRDGQTVRDDNGNQIGADIIAPAAIPGKAPDWQTRQAAGETTDKLRQRLNDITADRETLATYSDRLANDPASANLDDINEALDRLESGPLKRHLDQLSPTDPAATALHEETRTTSVAKALNGPAFDAALKAHPAFNHAAPGHSPAATAEPRPEPPAPDLAR